MTACGCRTSRCNGYPMDALFVFDVGDPTPRTLCGPGLAALVAMGMVVRRLPEWRARGLRGENRGKVLGAA